MYLIVPLSLISISIIGILAIVLRKKSYINKLYLIDTAGGGNEAALEAGQLSWISYVEELFPEFKIWLDKIHFNRYKTSLLIEIEKLLRRIRLMFLKIDRLSALLISKVRRVHVNDKLNKQDEAGDEQKVITQDATKVTEGKISANFLRNEEQRLIMEIAKNPKDFSLYEALGDMYVEMKSFIDAKESYEAAIELNPQNELLKQKLSRVLEKTNLPQA